MATLNPNREVLERINDSGSPYSTLARGLVNYLSSYHNLIACCVWATQDFVRVDFDHRDSNLELFLRISESGTQFTLVANDKVDVCWDYRELDSYFELLC